MKELKVIKFIKENSLQKLIEKYAIKVSRHNKYNNLICLKYNQIDTPRNDLTDECRGIILNEADNYNVVCYGFKRFYNYGEGRAANIDFKNSKIFEKLDGSLMQLYYYNNEWHVATSGTADASGQVGGFDITFKDLFWQVWKELKYSYPEDKNCCYTFELMTSKNRVIVRHKENKLVLHGCRDLGTLREQNPIVVGHINNWNVVKTLPFSNIEDVVRATSELNPIESEGFVVCDENYNRIKIKSEQYVSLSHLKEGITSRNLLNIVRANEQEEFLQHFEEYTEDFYKIKAKYERLVGEITGFYNAIRHIDDRKQFALIAKDQRFSGILFGLKFSGLSSIKEGLANMPIKNLEKIL